MKAILTLYLATAAATFAGAHSKPVSISETPYSLLDAYALSRPAIEEALRSTAEYQIHRYGPEIPTKNWLVGTFFSAFVAAFEETGDKWYLDQALDWSERSGWDIVNPLNADDVCPGQTYLDLYFLQQDPKMFGTLDEKLSPLFGREEIQPGELHEWEKEPKPFIGRNVWSWCDALYMAPPVYARLGKATGDKRYYEMLDDLYWDSVDFLYAPEERLFHRNSREQTEDDRSPSGKKVFWSRGNGWVLAGLARTIDYLPPDAPVRGRYLALFRDMAFSLARYQQEDGLWRSGLNDPEWYPTKETSGSAFFVYGIAKGLNEGWLPKEYFLPVVLKGWSGLMGCVTPEGRLGYSQIVAGSPASVRPHDSMDYAVGAFILAGCEMLRFDAESAMRTISEAAFQPRLVARDGAWTWFNDERVVLHDNVFYASYVKRNGKSALTAFALEKMPSVYARNEIILSTWEQKDDHNNAALLPLKDGGLLACYATHGRTPAFYQRKLELPRWDAARESEEQSFEVVGTRKGLTYQNLVRLEGEGGRIYNFFRGNNFNPNFVTSDDDAGTWSAPVHLIASGENSNRRPYVKYVSNGKDRIDFFYTDGHPRDVKQNNIRHFFYRDGAFHTSEGTVIRKMDELTGNPINAGEGTLVFDGSSDNGRGWVHDLEYDRNGQPYGAFISSPSGDVGTDMRYWTARFGNGEWTTEEIGFAGSNLYGKEQHYAGGIALDPHDDQRVVLSADVNPATGDPLPERIYQLFKGERRGNGWEWEQLTHDPVNDQLRPVLVRGRPKSLFWFAGQYTWFGDYHCDILASLDF